MSIAFNKISEPYAKALLEFSIAENCIGEMNKSVFFLTLAVNTPKLKELLNDPFLSRKAKKEGFKNFMVWGMGRYIVHYDPLLGSESVHNISLHKGSLSFIYMLIDRNRIEVLETIRDKFQELACNHYSLKTVVITSSVPIKALTLAKFKKRLKRLTAASQIFFLQKVEPSLIGGFIVEMDSKRIDVSIRGQLLQLSSFLGL
jgi:F-type H+-transporting ATPase subunit delta